MQNLSVTQRKTLILVSALVGLAVFGAAVGGWVIPYFVDRGSHQNIEDILNKTAASINKKAPMAIDAETRLDSAQTSNHEFRYRYTLINHNAEDISAREIQRTTWKTLLKNLCASNDMKTFRDNDVTVMYSYFGRDGRQIATLSASPSQCAER